ncbi:MAG: hypothetical protein IJ297_06910 [Clostridia bacterium]|nr:hypothetical protein [Clostridia bacterium]
MKKLISLFLVFILISMVVPSYANEDEVSLMADALIAFPGAEGAGRYATGGRGGSVYHVTNLNDSGAGSFRDAVSASNRIIVFDVGGTIELTGDVVVKGNNTIAGQTAPGGGGITLRGGKIGMGGDNIIIRYVSSRPGENGSSECDAWGGDKGSNSIIDHCSIGWANDEQFGLYSNNTNQTVQYSLIGPSNCISYHSKGAHGFGIMLGKANNTWHHNMIAHNISRNYRGKSTGAIDYVNNVIYNWGYQTAYGTFGQVNYVGNYFKAGLSTTGGYRYVDLSSGTGYDKFRFYLTGNKMVTSTGADYDASMNTNNWNGFNFRDTGLTRSNLEVTTPIAVYDSQGQNATVAYNAQSADAAFETVLNYAGAGIRADLRPKIDKQVMQEARTGTGYLTGGRDFDTLTSSDTALNEAIEKYSIKEMNYDEYYPQPVTKKEITDADNDGMDDTWELARGLNTSVNDAMGDYLGQGYNNIEYYINDLTVDSFPKGVVTLSSETVELGDNYEKAKEAADSLKLSDDVIKAKGDVILPVKAGNGAVISWQSSSAAIVIENNAISKVNRPGTYDASVTLTAGVTYGDFTLNKSFVVTVPAQPLKFDFGNGDVQSGFVKVNASKLYSQSSPYGFVSASQSDMTRAPGNVPSGYEALHADQIQGETTFKAEVPNGTYTVVVHYGCWNTSFGTSFTIEGVNTGNLYATDVAQYVTEIKITDGLFELNIRKGDKAYGGYVNGLEILKPEYYFDFGSGNVQEGYTQVTAADVYSDSVRFGFSDASSQYDMERAPGGIKAGYENLHADQIQGTATFKVKLPNGKYTVTAHYGCWNSGYGTRYNIEGVDSGNLYSTTAAEYVTEVSVTDGVLDLGISKGSKSYGGYINGLDIVMIEPDKKATIKYSDGTVTVVGENVTKAVLIHASYNGDAMSYVSVTPLKFDNGVATVTKTLKQGDKLFVWNSITKMEPLSAVYVN